MAEDEVGEPDPDAAGPPDGGLAAGRPARTTLMLGLAVTAAFLVGMAGVSLVAGDDGPTAPGVQLDIAPSRAERVPASTRAPLPAMTLAGFGGEDAPPVDLSAYEGTPLVVNFWASWCAPCVREMPDFQVFSDAFAGRVPLLGVNVRDAPSNAQAFVAELGVTYDLASDPDGELYAAVGAFGMPTTLFVDDAGMIVYRHTGPLDVEDLRELVAEHLGVEA